MSRPLLVGIACNIKTGSASDDEAEFDEFSTVEAIAAALRSGGYGTVILEASDGFPRKLEAAAPDIVFNIAEGRSGRSREAQIPAILEYCGVPYTGSDAAALAAALDKALCKRVTAGVNVRTPEFYTVKSGDPDFPGKIPFPVIVKPNAEGSSRGVTDASVAEDRAGLRAVIGRLRERYAGEPIAERYVGGREFTVGLLGNGPGVRVLEPMEIVYERLRGRYPVYSYEVKRNYRDYVSYRCPADIPAALGGRLKRGARAVFDALGCLDFLRADFRVDRDGEPWFIEANPLPGLAPGYSDFPMLAEFNGVGYDALILEMLHCALKRYGMED